MKTLEQQLKTQKYINLALGVGLAAVTSFTLLSSQTPTHFEEISVERINIVEKNGLNRMVLANSDKAPGIDKYGKEVLRAEEARPGMIFYNDEGTENGGFIFRGEKKDGKVNQGLHMSFDRYNQDQTLMMQHIEMDDYMITGLTVMDRPNTDLDIDLTKHYLEAVKIGDMETAAAIEKRYNDEKLGGAHRAFYGTLNGDSKLQLHDVEGNKRIQMVVTKDGEAKLEFLDAEGKVILRIPENGTNE